MLIYTDNKIALYYECGEETDNGECKPGSEYVEVMYRENHAPAYLKMVYGRVLEDFCVNAEDLIIVDHEGNLLFMFGIFLIETVTVLGLAECTSGSAEHCIDNNLKHGNSHNIL